MFYVINTAMTVIYITKVRVVCNIFSRNIHMQFNQKHFIVLTTELSQNWTNFTKINEKSAVYLELA